MPCQPLPSSSPTSLSLFSRLFPGSLSFPTHRLLVHTIIINSIDSVSTKILFSSTRGVSCQHSCKSSAPNMKVPSVAWLAFLLVKPVSGALVGYGIYPYEPPCAFACDRSLSSLTLECSSDMAMESGMDMMGPPMTSPQCRAGDSPWLATLAWCMHVMCDKYNVSTSELEAFWEKQSTEDPTVVPKWGYTTTLFNIANPPTRPLSDAEQSLNSNALGIPAVFTAHFNALTAVQRENVVESAFG